MTVEIYRNQYVCNFTQYLEDANVMALIFLRLTSSQNNMEPGKVTSWWFQPI